MSDHSELEPCPYCGGHASLSKVGRDWYRIAADHVTGCPLEDFQLDCPQSDDQLPLMLHDWNTRVDRRPANCAERDQLKAENEALRKIISESATACGAAVSVECSLEFMAMLPGEIASVIGKLRQECAARHPFRPALDQPLIGYTGCVICGQYTDHQGLPCPNKRAFAMSKGAGHD